MRVKSKWDTFCNNKIPFLIKPHLLLFQRDIAEENPLKSNRQVFKVSKTGFMRYIL